MTGPRVAAIILSYNGRDLALGAVATLAGQDHRALEVVLVDNGSSDGTAAAVRAAWPQVTVLEVVENRGISWGLNHGIRWALGRGADYLLLLNNDIEAHPAMVRELLAAAASDPRIGVVGPKTYYYDERDRLWSAGGVLRFREAVTRERGMGRRDRGQYDRSRDVDYINGCAMLVRREVFEAVGLWDPAYHVSVEDADFCVRARRAGFRCHYAHRAVLWHMVSRSTGGYRAGRTYHTGRSTALFVRRHARPWQWASFLACFAASLPVAWLREAPRGNGPAVVAKLRGVIAGLTARLGEPPRWPEGGAGEAPAPASGPTGGA